MAKKTARKTTTKTRTGQDRRGGDRRQLARVGAEKKRNAPTEVLLVATTNRDKLKEIIAILGPLPVTLKTLKDFPKLAVAEETGSTFAENARQKALHYAKATGLLTLAEDSGFEVDAIGCEPGIHSARYLRPNASYPERFDEIYREVQKKKTAPRSARFVCAVALAMGTKIQFETKASVEGELAEKPGGDRGFGYDPIFCYPPYGKTFAEVSPEQKRAVSHRGEAIRALRSHLEQYL
jgi:XTP/dITP diphosphohydrolase